MDDDSRATAVGKLSIVWGGVGISKLFTAVGISSWGDFAALCASIYTLIQIYKFLREAWKNRKKDNHEPPTA